MAGNTEEFDRIAMEVCTDVNDNFNQAAYGCAQAIYQNMNSAKRDVASLATQAQQTADAIAGMANGVKAGSSAVAGGSGGGSLDSGISLNLSGANFQGTDYSYEAKSISLDDFISDLELDIQSGNYEEAYSIMTASSKVWTSKMLEQADAIATAQYDDLLATGRAEDATRLSETFQLAPERTYNAAIEFSGLPWFWVEIPPVPLVPGGPAAPLGVPRF